MRGARSLHLLYRVSLSLGQVRNTPRLAVLSSVGFLPLVGLLININRVLQLYKRPVCCLTLIDLISAWLDLTCLGTCLCLAILASWGWFPYFSFSFSLYWRATLSLSLMMPILSLARAFHSLMHISSLPLRTYLLSRLQTTLVSLCILLV